MLGGSELVAHQDNPSHIQDEQSLWPGWNWPLLARIPRVFQDPPLVLAIVSAASYCPRGRCVRSSFKTSLCSHSCFSFDVSETCTHNRNIHDRKV